MARMVVGTLVTLLLVLAPYTITTAQEPTLTSLIVKLRPGLAPTAVVARNGGVLTSSIEPLELYVVTVLTSDLSRARARYDADPDVQHVETDTCLRLGTVSDDLSGKSL